MFLATATNPQTGEKQGYDGSRWVPIKTATNPKTGEQVAFDGQDWQPVQATSVAGDLPSSPEAPPVEEAGPQFDASGLGLEGQFTRGQAMENPDAQAVARGIGESVHAAMDPQGFLDMKTQERIGLAQEAARREGFEPGHPEELRRVSDAATLGRYRGDSEDIMADAFMTEIAKGRSPQEAAQIVEREFASLEQPFLDPIELPADIITGGAMGLLHTTPRVAASVGRRLAGKEIAKIAAREAALDASIGMGAMAGMETADQLTDNAIAPIIAALGGGAVTNALIRRMGIGGVRKMLGLGSGSDVPKPGHKPLSTWDEPAPQQVEGVVETLKVEPNFQPSPQVRQAAGPGQQMSEEEAQVFAEQVIRERDLARRQAAQQAVERPVERAIRSGAELQPGPGEVTVRDLPLVRQRIARQEADRARAAEVRRAVDREMALRPEPRPTPEAPRPKAAMAGSYDIEGNYVPPRQTERLAAAAPAALALDEDEKGEMSDLGKAGLFVAAALSAGKSAKAVKAVGKRGSKAQRQLLKYADDLKKQYAPVKQVRLSEAQSKYLVDGKFQDYVDTLPTTGGASRAEIYRSDRESVRQGIAVVKDKKTFKTRAVIRVMGGYAAKEVQDAIKAGKVKDLPKGVTDRSMSTTQLFKVIGGNKDSGNVMLDHGLRIQQDAQLGRQNYFDLKRSELNDIFVEARLRGRGWGMRKKREIVGRLTDKITPRMRSQDPSELLKNKEIASVLESVSYGKERLIKAAQKISAWMESTLADANKVRGKMGSEKIGFVEGGYAPKIAKRTFWDRRLGRNPIEAEKGGPPPGYIHPNQTPNPRAKARTDKEYARDFDIRTLAINHLDYMSKEIFLNPVIDHNKALAQLLEYHGLSRSAKAIQRYTDEVLARTAPELTAFLDQMGPSIKALRTVSRDIANGLKRSVLPGNLSFILFRQVSSAALTVARFGGRNSVRALRDMFNSRVKQLFEHSYHGQMKRGSATGFISDAVSTQGTRNFDALDTRGKVSQFLDWTTGKMEELLSRHAHAAALRDGELRLKLKGRELSDYASRGIGQTQSMYNYEDVPGILRNKDVTSLVPFQTFYLELMNTARDMGWRVPAAEGLKGRRFKAVAEFMAAATIFNMVHEWGRGDQAYDTKNALSYIPFIGTVGKGWLPTTGAIIGATPGEAIDGRGFRPPVAQYVADFWKGMREILEDGDATQAAKWFSRYHVKGGSQAMRMAEGFLAASQGSFKAGKTRVKVRGPVEKARAVTLGKWNTEAGIEYRHKRWGKPGIFSSLTNNKR